MEVIKKEFLTVYGYDNKNISVTDIVDAINLIIEKINKPRNENFELVESKGPAPARSPTAFTTEGDFEYGVDNNALYIHNTNIGKHIYLTIGKGYNRNLIFYSNTLNEQGNFRGIKFKGNVSDSWDNIMVNYLKLFNGPNIMLYQKIFADTKTMDDIYDILKNKYSLSPLAENEIRRTRNHTKGSNTINMFGWGIHNEPIPEHVKFGKMILLLNKLIIKIYYL